MKTIQRIGITLTVCFCLALPAAAQKNPGSLQRALTRASATQTLPLCVKTLIINLPSRPSVHIIFDALPASPGKNSVRLLPPRQVYPLLYKLEKHKIFVPRDFVNQTKSLYRGMAITDIDELENILVNGLEIEKSHHNKKIFTAPDPSTAILYAQPTHRFSINANLPVLIKIPLTSSLKQYAPKQFTNATVFHKSIPASAISDVWILLKVNKKVDWYKVTLEDGEIVLFPAYGQLQNAQ